MNIVCTFTEEAFKEWKIAHLHNLILHAHKGLYKSK